MVAFNFGRGAYEEIARTEIDDGGEIRAITVKQLKLKVVTPKKTMQRSGKMASEKKEEHIEWSYPYCGTINNVPETATTCQNCGKRFYSSGIEVENKESTKLYEEIEKRRKRKVKLTWNANKLLCPLG